MVRCPECEGLGFIETNTDCHTCHVCGSFGEITEDHAQERQERILEAQAMFSQDPMDKTIDEIQAAYSFERDFPIGADDDDCFPS